MSSGFPDQHGHRERLAGWNRALVPQGQAGESPKDTQEGRVMERRRLVGLRLPFVCGGPGR